MDDIALLLRHMEDLAQKTQKTGIAHSKFLTPCEAAEVARTYRNRKDIDLALDGGFSAAERKVAVFIQPDWGEYNQSEVLAAIEIKHREKDLIRHQDVLGSALGLGLSRDVLGDIFIEPGKACAVCLASIVDFIVSELQKVGRVGVTVNRIDIAGLPETSTVLKEKAVTVASLRLDAVIAAAFDFSRSDASETIEAGKVQLNHRECLNVSHAVEARDIISIRGKGRFNLMAVQGETRKGRLRLTLGLY